MPVKTMLGKSFLLFCVLLFVVSVSPSIAQSEEESETGFQLTYGADLVSQYVWRGSEIGEKMGIPHLQPGINLDYLTRNSGTFTAYVWASYGISANYLETDFALSYEFETRYGTFGLGFTDYYYPYLRTWVLNFDKNGEGAHTIEGQFTYTFIESFPIQVLLASNLHNDLSGDNSLYIESSYPFDAGRFSFNLLAGAAKGESIYYGIDKEKFQLISTGITIGTAINFSEKFALPVGLDLIYNPFSEKGYVVFRVSYFLNL